MTRILLYRNPQIISTYGLEDDPGTELFRLGLLNVYCGG